MDINESLTTLLSRTLSNIKRYNEETNKYIQQVYFEFVPHDGSCEIYIEEGINLIVETKAVLEKYECETSANRIELESYAKEVSMALAQLELMHKILNIDNLFDEAGASGDYLFVLELLNKVKLLLYGRDDEENIDLRRHKCFENLKVRYHTQTHILRQILTEKFNNMVQFKEKLLPNSQYVTISIHDSEHQLHDIVLALFQTNYNPEELCEFLLKKCFEPIIKKNVVIEVKEESEDKIELKLTYTPKVANTTSKTFYQEVLNNIRLVLNTLNKMNVSLTMKDHVLSIIGDKVNEHLLPMLINKCLLPCVPENEEEYQSSTILEDITKFEHFLEDIFFIDPKRHTYLATFSENFQIIYRNRYCRKILETAKKIMMKSLQDMTAQTLKNEIVEFSSNPLGFANSMTISKSILEYVKLIEAAILEDIDANKTNSDNVRSGILPLLINAYIVQAPNLHMEFLKSFPQQTALFHNNCMFLAYWMLKFAKIDRLLFSSLINSLQLTAKKYLDMQIAAQKSSIMKILNNFEIDGNIEQLHSMHIIKNCFNKLDLLKNVWQNVLPEATYNTTIQNLLNDLLYFIINKIIAKNNLSSNIVSEIVNILNYIIEKSPNLFKNRRCMDDIINWTRVQILRRILKGTPQEIAELWCKNIKTESLYQADEIKNIVRAMFPNTEARAKALSKVI